jgi:two-component system, NarL family, response regulator DesR
VIRTLVALRGGLARGALAFLLSQDPEIEVVAKVDDGPDVEAMMRAHRPDVSVVDLDLTGPDGVPVVCTLHRRLPEAALLILADRRRSGVLEQAIGAGRGRVGFLAKDHPPDQLLSAVRALAGGQTIEDPYPLRGTIRAGSPLTPREREVLWVAANGGPVREIAATLRLSSGTVHNHLSRIISKTNSRSRVEALRVARDAGWI